MLTIKERNKTLIEEELLVQLYISTRIDEFASLGWTEDQLFTFLQAQYEMQKSSYSHQYPNAKYEMIYEGEVCLGRLITNKQEDHIHIVDISLFPEYRGKGKGTAILKALQEEAREKEIPITLSVLQGNPAIHLYLRLGFVVTDEVPPYISMRFDK